MFYFKKQFCAKLALLLCLSMLFSLTGVGQLLFDDAGVVNVSASTGSSGSSGSYSHSFSYWASGKMLGAKCRAYGHSDAPFLTITAADKIECGDSSQIVMVEDTQYKWRDYFDTFPTISYVGRGETVLDETEDFPDSVGEYTAKIKDGGVEVSIDFETVNVPEGEFNTYSVLSKSLEGYIKVVNNKDGTVTVQMPTLAFDNKASYGGIEYTFHYGYEFANVTDPEKRINLVDQKWDKHTAFSNNERTIDITINGENKKANTHLHLLVVGHPTSNGSCPAPDSEKFIGYYCYTNPVKITYVLNGGNMSGSEDDKFEEYLTNGEDLHDAPERAGYTFNGWYTAAEDGEEVTQCTGTAATYYAHWKVHEHNWIYSATGNKLEAYCSNAGCLSETSVTHKVSLTLTAGDKDYSGSEAYTGASFDADELDTFKTATGLNENPTITYYKVDTEGATTGGTLKTAAEVRKAAGNYYAKATIEGKSVVAAFKVNKIAPAADDFTYTAPTNLTYDGNAKNAVVAAKTGKTNGTITVKYYDSTDNEVTAPKNVGTYKVKVTVTAGDNYNAVTTPIEVGTFTITKGTYTGTKTATGNLLAKNGRTITVELPELPEGASYGTASNTNTDFFTVGSVTDGKVIVTSAKDWDKTTESESKTFIIPVTGADIYNDYSVTVTIVPAFHTHDWEYSLVGADTIKAHCKAASHDGDDVTLTITVSNDVYSGNAVKATVDKTAWEAAGLAAPDVVYEAKTGSTLTDGNAVNVGTYTAMITVDDKAATKDFEITKATPTISTVPTASAITYGETLADSTLTGGAANVTGTFAWTSGATKPLVADSGKTEYEVTFTPADTKNYDIAACTVKVEVNKADYTDTELVKTASVNLRAKKDKSAEVDLPALPEGASYGDVTNANTELFAVGAITDGKVTITAAKDFAAEDMEDKTFAVDVNADANHNNAKVTVTVKPFNKKTQTITAENVTVAYGDTGKSISAVTTTGGGALSYILKSGDAVEVDAAGALTIKKAGTAVITVNAAENDEYEAATKDVTVTVDKGEISPSVSISGWIEGENANAPSVAGNTGNGDVTYKYKEKNAETSAYSTEVPTAAGEYTLKAEIAETDNYKSGVATVDFTIAEPHKHVLGTKHDSVSGNCVDKGTLEWYECTDSTCNCKLDKDGNELTSIEGTINPENHKGTATTWTKTETTHKETYNCCGAVKTAEANHTGGTATCLSKAKCSVCEAEYGEIGDHNWGSWTTAADEKSCKRVCVNDETHKETTEHTGTTCDRCGWIKHTHTVKADSKVEAKAATCIAGGNIEYYLCDGCDVKLDKDGNVLTSVEGTINPENHKGTATTWTKTETTHKETYNCCGAVKTAEANHTGGTATCLSKAKCSVCEAEYGEIGDHNWGSWTTAADEKSCTRVCVNDETHKETTEHTGTTCDRCGWIKHTHTVKADSKVEAKAATCIACGNIEYYLCDGCDVKLDKDGNVLDSVETSIDANAHNWGSWTTVADEKSCTRVCVNDAEHKETTEHTGTTCDKCGWSKKADVNKGVDELSKLLDDTTNKEDKVVYSQQNINDQGRLAYTVNKAKIKKIVVTSLDGVSTNITMTVNAKAKFVLPGGDTKWTVDSASGVKNKVSKYNKKVGGCIIIPKAKKNSAYDQVLTSENGYKVTLHVEDLKISKDYKKMTVSAVNGPITITPVDGTEKVTGIQAGIWSCRRPKTSTTKAKFTNIGAAGSTAQVSIGRKATATAVVNADGSVTLSNATGKGTAVMIYRVNNRKYSVKIKFAEPKKTK